MTAWGSSPVSHHHVAAHNAATDTARPQCRHRPPKVGDNSPTVEDPDGHDVSSAVLRARGPLIARIVDDHNAPYTEEMPMTAIAPDYFTLYSSLRMSRHAEGRSSYPCPAHWLRTGWNRSSCTSRAIVRGAWRHQASELHHCHMDPRRSSDRCRVIRVTDETTGEPLASESWRGFARMRAVMCSIARIGLGAVLATTTPQPHNAVNSSRRARPSVRNE